MNELQSYFLKRLLLSISLKTRLTYNRVGYTLVSKHDPSLSSDSCPLKDAVFSMVKAAFENIDFELHSGSHPRLGVVDHICFHPLASTSLEQVAGTAKALAKDVGSVLKGLRSFIILNV